MRILHVHSGNLYGGVETYMVTLVRCRHMVPAMEHEFALCFRERLSDELQEHRATVQMIGEVRVRYPWTVTRARRKLQQLLEKNRYDIAVCHSPWSQAIFGPVIQRTGTVNVFYLHGRAACRHWIERWAARVRPDYAISNSHYTQTSLADIYPELDNEVVYLPVAPLQNASLADRFAIRSELCTTQDSTVIIQVGRMEEGKGHAQHLEALGELRENPDWVAWIVGGAQRPSEQRYLQLLKERARHLQIADRIHFLGQRRDVGKLLAAADIFCQPNVAGESFGISFVEALYASLPVVTTNIGSVPEVITEFCGILIQPQDTIALRDALSTLLTSRALRSRLGGAGAARAFEISDPATQLERLYQVLHHVLSDSLTSNMLTREHMEQTSVELS